MRQYEPSIGGLESYVKSMATRQAAKGHDVEILTLDRIFHSEHGALRGEEIMGPLVVHRTPFVGKRRFFIPLIHPKILKKFDIIHVHNTDTFFEYCAIFGTLFKKKMVATTHGGFFHTKDFSAIKQLYFNLITKFSSKAYKAMFAISQNDFNTFQGMNANLQFMPNAVEPLGDFMTDGRDYMYFGRLAAHKGVENVIKAYAAMVKKTGTHSRLHIIGPEWDVEISDLKAMAQTEDVADRVIIHGPLSQQDLQNVAKQCGYFVSGSTYEGFGMSMIETMAVGMIPLVFPNESFKELVGKAGVGACIDYGADPNRAADQIIEAQKNIQADDKVKAQKFAGLYSWDKLADETLKVYEE